MVSAVRVNDWCTIIGCKSGKLTKLARYFIFGAVYSIDMF